MTPVEFVGSLILVGELAYFWGKAVEREQARDRKRHKAAKRLAEEDEVDTLLTQVRIDQLDQVYAKSQRTQPSLDVRERAGGRVPLRLVHSGIPGETGVGDAGKAASRARHPAGRARNLQDQ